MQSHKFFPYRGFINSCSGITVAKWDTYVMENTADKTKRCHPGYPVAEAKLFSPKFEANEAEMFELK